MSFRVINKICGSQAEADKICESLKGKVSAPHTVYSQVTGSWLVVLYECQNRPRIEEARKHYSSLGITAYIQIY